MGSVQAEGVKMHATAATKQIDADQDDTNGEAAVHL
jgi:hypothetical protein